MYEFYDNFFFGKSGKKKSLADIGIINKKWAGLLNFYHLLDLVTGRFKYTLTDSMSARYLELCLIMGGKAAIIEKDGELLNLRITAGNTVSRYGDFNNFQLVDYAGRGYGNFIPNCPSNINPDAALILDNLDYGVPPIYRIKYYAEQLTRVEAGMNACIMNMRGSTIINCSTDQAKAIRKAYLDIEDGVPVLFAFSEFEGAGQERPEITNVPQSSELLMSLQECYDKLMSRFCTEFGINAHGVINKLAGVSARELEQNEQATEIALKKAFDARKETLEKASAMFGVELKCEIAFDTDYNDGEDDYEDDADEEVNDDDISGSGR